LSGVESLERWLLEYLQQRQADGDDGRTLLVGLRGAAPAFALAAGLHGSADHPRFLIFARYLLHRRFACDGFALMLPAELDGTPVYVIEQRCAGSATVAVCYPDGRIAPFEGRSALIGDLALAPGQLPALERRDFDRLYASLVRPLPAALSD